MRAKILIGLLLAGLAFVVGRAGFKLIRNQFSE